MSIESPENLDYAKYMRAWIHNLTMPSEPAIFSAFAALEQHWDGVQEADLDSIRVKLWAWINANGGPRISDDRSLLVARMVLCLAYEDNRELEDMGFFDDLLHRYGVPRQTINLYGAGNLPPRA